MDISQATPGMMRVLARRLNGRSVLVLSEKGDFDQSGFYRLSSGMDGAVRTESFLVFAVDSLADEWLAKIGCAGSDDPPESTPGNDAPEP